MNFETKELNKEFESYIRRLNRKFDLLDDKTIKNIKNAVKEFETANNYKKEQINIWLFNIIPEGKLQKNYDLGSPQNIGFKTEYNIINRSGYEMENAEKTIGKRKNRNTLNRKAKWKRLGVK